jgi:hypothetical protein
MMCQLRENFNKKLNYFKVPAFGSNVRGRFKGKMVLPVEKDSQTTRSVFSLISWKPFIKKHFGRCWILAGNLLNSFAVFLLMIMNRKAAKEATMNESVLSLLGINDLTLSSLRSGQMPGMLGNQQAKSEFAEQLEELLAAYYAGASNTGNNTEGGSLSANQTVPAVDGAPTLPFGGLFKDIMLARLRAGRSENEETPESITEEDLLFDSLVTGTADSTETSDAISGTPAFSASDIVFQTGGANADLIQKMNAAATIEERLDYSVQLRDKIVEALKEAGHTAYDIGKPDKISIDGTLYDVIKASRGMGRRAAVQFMEMNATNQADEVSQAIFAAGEKHQNMLSGVSGTSDVSQRHALGTQFRDHIVANLKDQGYNVSAGSSPDKITVNGVSYDIIRGLNAVGAQALFHVIRA